MLMPLLAGRAPPQRGVSEQSDGPDTTTCSPTASALEGKVRPSLKKKKPSPHEAEADCKPKEPRC